MEEKQIYTKESLLVTDNEVFEIRLYDDSLKEFQHGIAYLDNGYYYTYKGEVDLKDLLKNTYIKPGIYKDKISGEIYLQVPLTDNDKEKYSYQNKISSIEPEKIIDMINNHEQILVVVPDSTKIFLPSLSNNDDILKRLIKKALIEKNIDIDHYRHRFIDKNALFNFKQVIKGDNKLSMLLFDRGCEALNLKYTIIIDEIDPETPIGEKLHGPITASSEDTFDL